jgi:hypothetical protein
MPMMNPVAGRRSPGSAASMDERHARACTAVPGRATDHVARSFTNSVLGHGAWRLRSRGPQPGNDGQLKVPGCRQRISGSGRGTSRRISRPKLSHFLAMPASTPQPKRVDWLHEARSRSECAASARDRLRCRAADHCPPLSAGTRRHRVPPGRPRGIRAGLPLPARELSLRPAGRLYVCDSGA